MTGQAPDPAALITGGATSIGLATARVLHDQGFAVLATGRDPATLAAAQAALPGDVMVAFLASPGAGYITGADIVLDGGMPA